MRADGRDKRGVWLGAALTGLVTAAALFLAYRTVRNLSVAEIGGALAQVDAWRLPLALALTLLCYTTLSGYDVIALRSLGRNLAWRRALCGSTSAYALSHNLGFAPVTATFARGVVYRHDGIGMGDAARIVVITGTAFWLGVLLMLGTTLVALPSAVLPHLGRLLHVVIGASILLAVAGYVAMIAMGARRMGLGRWSIPLPSFRDALLQLAISIAETTTAGMILWILMPHVGLALYPAVLVAYVTAFVAVLLAHTPGGAGVLETVVLVMLPEVDKATVVSALILFRIVFHLLPLGAALLIVTHHHRKPVAI